MPFTNEANGSHYWNLNQLAHRFYYSRFNRDNMHDPKEGEDINNSRMYRLYNKSDIKELLHSFAEFLEWVIPEENLGKIYLTDNMVLVRRTQYPYIKRANDVIAAATQRGGREPMISGRSYIFSGKYVWNLDMSGELAEKMEEVMSKDPQFMAFKEKLQKELEERNKKEIDEEQQSKH